MFKKVGGRKRDTARDGRLEPAAPWRLASQCPVVSFVLPEQNVIESKRIKYIDERKRNINIENNWNGHRGEWENEWNGRDFTNWISWERSGSFLLTNIFSRMRDNGEHFNHSAHSKETEREIFTLSWSNCIYKESKGRENKLTLYWNSIIHIYLIRWILFDF